MRSLQEWMEYVRQQRRAAQRGAPSEAEPASAEEKAPAPSAEPAAPAVAREAQATAPSQDEGPAASDDHTADDEAVLAALRTIRRTKAANQAADMAELLDRIGPPEDAPGAELGPTAATAERQQAREQLRAWQARQQRLPLDISEEAAPRRRGRAAKETREELIQRLLDPELTLREVAMLLNVCPTTVRRYTNRGVLNHFRTPGNQRRFRLSDVLDFMRRQQEGG